MDCRVILVAAAVIASATIGVGAQKLPDQQSAREAQEFNRAGQKYLAGEQFDRAVDAFSSAVVKDNLLSGAYYGMGQAYMNLQRFSDAAKAYAAAPNRCAACTRCSRRTHLTSTSASRMRSGR